MAILSDIIEHFTKDEGLKLLDNLFDHVEDIVIATPFGFLEHKASDENPYEKHKSGWKLEDFSQFKIVDHAIIDRIRKPEKLLVVYLRKNK